jgi:hypothetical protein
MFRTTILESHWQASRPCDLFPDGEGPVGCESTEPLRAGSVVRPAGGSTRTSRTRWAPASPSVLLGEMTQGSNAQLLDSREM